MLAFFASKEKLLWTACIIVYDSILQTAASWLNLSREAISSGRKDILSLMKK